MATCFAARARQSLLAEPQLLPAGAARRNLHTHVAIQGGYLHTGAQRRLPRGDVQVMVQIATLYPKLGVWLELDVQVVAFVFDVLMLWGLWAYYKSFTLLRDRLCHNASPRVVNAYGLSAL